MLLNKLVGLSLDKAIGISAGYSLRLYYFSKEGEWVFPLQHALIAFSYAQVI